jgi:hypothetical protein
MLNHCTDEPAIQPAENPANSDGKGDFDGTLPESKVRVS